MTTRRVGFVVVALATLAAGAQAQRRSPSVARITPYVGYMHFGNYVDGPFGTGVRNAGAPVYGAQLGIDLSDNFAFVGNVGYSDSNLEVGLPIVGGLDFADAKVLLYDAGVQYRLPTPISLGREAVPFVEAGAGAMRTEIGVGSLRTQSTAFAANYGAGIDLQVSRGLTLRAMAKDYVGRLDLKEATMIDLKTQRTHNWAFTAGISVKF
ncbi:MAG: outer membrane beta-barrel protein [Gemmatimonadetes bacterium]|nr:outer membrane beta-barrel protein [Gemmatimonadota bacterium]